MREINRKDREKYIYMLSSSTLDTWYSFVSDKWYNQDIKLLNMDMKIQSRYNFFNIGYLYNKIINSINKKISDNRSKL